MYRSAQGGLREQKERKKKVLLNKIYLALSGTNQNAPADLELNSIYIRDICAVLTSKLNMWGENSGFYRFSSRYQLDKFYVTCRFYLFLIIQTQIVSRWRTKVRLSSKNNTN